MQLLRTPDDRFAGLEGFDHEPRYVEIDGARLCYVEDGPPTADPVLLLHGEPTWSYLYRKMIPIIVGAGHRVVAPDLLGFGRSDKPARIEDHSHAGHVRLMTGLVERLDLRRVTLVCQDWGGLIGLRVLAERPDRFARVVAANTGLPAAHPVVAWLPPMISAAAVHGARLTNRWLRWDEIRRGGGGGTRKGRRRAPRLPAGLLSPLAFLRWLVYSQTVADLSPSAVVQLGTREPLSPAAIAAYEAPFPDARYKAGPRAMPALVMTEPAQNHRAWRVLERWDGAFVCAFSDGDPITGGQQREFLRRVPAARGQRHTTILGAGHFLQEDRGEELAGVVVQTIAS